MNETDEILESILEVEDEEQRLKRTRQAHQRERTRLLKQIEELERKCDLLTVIDGATVHAPKWPSPPKSGSTNRGIANLILSDLHLDEVVKPQEVSGVNAYNREIALMRLKKVFEKFVTIGRDFVTGLTYDGGHIWLNGDTFSGNIHEELKITNEVPIMASLDFWVDPIVSGIRMAADEYKKLHISGRVGNHGRNTPKPIMKGRVEDNFDWLFYRILYRELASDKRITWDLPLSSDGEVIHQYDTSFLATHGDQFRGGSGISGILTPLSLGDFRKSRRQIGVDAPYDYLILGHFHQYMSLPRIIVNGSLKGYDEYAFQSNFGYEVPQQAFWVTTPEHSVSFAVGIKPQDRRKERW